MNAQPASWKEYVDTELTVDMRPRWARDFEGAMGVAMRRMPRRRLRVLELGCSSGRWLRWMRERGQYRFLEINGEPSPEAVHADILEKLNLPW